MNRVSKIVPPKREILKDVSLSFFPGAKIGVLGLNGSGKSTLLKIMAGLDVDFQGEARAMPDLKVGYLAQEPHLDPDKDVRGNVEDGMREAVDALRGLDQVYLDYAEPDADFDALAKKQGDLEAIIESWDAHNLDHALDVAADALRLPPWDADVTSLSGGEKRRVALCRLLLSRPDMLLLDEPTNHLDITSKEVLKSALKAYAGSVIIVSHDRDFLSDLSTKVVEFRDGVIKTHIGDINDYLSYRKIESMRELERRSENDNKNRSKKPEGKKDKKIQEKEIKKFNNQLSKIEREIDKLEAFITSCDLDLANPEKSEILCSDLVFFKNYQNSKNKLIESMKAWEKKQIQLDDLYSQRG